MRKIVNIPRILKINWIKEVSISVMYNNGENRIIDFRSIFKRFGVKPGDPEHILLSPQEFAKVKLMGTTLSWSNVELYMTSMGGKEIRVPFEMGADTLYQMSKPDKSIPISRIGKMIREARKRSGLTQQELAIKSGTTRNYISRIENDRSGIELDTLRKIIEVGLGKKLEVSIK